jgi:multidrug efflux system membrane fusion protein
VKQLEATVDADAAAVENAQVQLSYATIASPIDGRTGIRQTDVGNIVRTSDANGIVTVSQIEPISVLFSLPQQNLPAINAQLAQGKLLTVEALSSDTGMVVDSGEVALVDNQIDQTTGTVKLKATLPNREHALWPGGFTNVRLTLSITSHAMTIPTVAVQHGPRGAFVFVYKPAADAPDKGTVAMTAVTTGITNGEDTEILKGLSDDDRVVVDGMGKLQDQSRVRLAGAEKSDDEAPAQRRVPK